MFIIKWTSTIHLQVTIMITYMYCTVVFNLQSICKGEIKRMWKAPKGSYERNISQTTQESPRFRLNHPVSHTGQQITQSRRKVLHIYSTNFHLLRTVLQFKGNFGIFDVFLLMIQQSSNFHSIFLEDWWSSRFQFFSGWHL